VSTITVTFFVIVGVIIITAFGASCIPTDCRLQLYVAILDTFYSVVYSCGFIPVVFLATFTFLCLVLGNVVGIHGSHQLSLLAPLFVMTMVIAVVFVVIVVRRLLSVYR